eukprot:Skav220727  [mRNA]  locus=scaffold2753:167789:180465:- [translate_table: standard]
MASRLACLAARPSRWTRHMAAFAGAARIKLSPARDRRMPKTKRSRQQLGLVMDTPVGEPDSWLRPQCTDPEQQKLLKAHRFVGAAVEWHQNFDQLLNAYGQISNPEPAVMLVSVMSVTAKCGDVAGTEVRTC